jgi:hypothetical protein
MLDFSMSSAAVVVLIGLVAGHLMIDFAFQTDNDIRLKRQFRASAFAKHGFVHAAVAYCLSGLWLMWQIPVVILLIHPVVDFVKERGVFWLGSRVRDGIFPVRWKLAALLADQTLHISVLVALVAMLQSSGRIGESTFWTALFGSTWGKMMILAAGFTFSVYVGGVVIAILVQPLVSQLRIPAKDSPESPRRRGFDNGGRYIGQLERTLIFLFVLIGQPTGVGFLVAAKSVFRFGDLKEHEDRMEAEYIIIGTMLSFAWGLVAAWLTQYVLQQL